MEILIIGGTQFVGRALTRECLNRGHRVTHFNRGKSNPDAFPEVETIVGDRDGGLEPLGGRRWDAVIDTCGYVPRLVEASADLLAEAVDQYVFISTISVFKSLTEVGVDENAPLGTMEDETVEEITGETYGPLKVLCEQAVERHFPGRALIIRPGLITGPFDHTDRFGYWPARVDRGGAVLVPGRPERSLQHIDARDLAAFTVDLIERRAFGTFNATGPAELLTMGELIDACREIATRDADIHWVDEQFLIDQGVTPWQELPFWLPELDPDTAGFMRVSCQKAIDAGLTFRPVLETVRDWLVWHKSREDHTWKTTLTPEREAELLALWQKEHQFR